MHKHFVRKIIRSQWAKLTFMTNFLHKGLVCCTLLHNFSKAVDIKDKKMAFSWKAVGCSFAKKGAKMKFELWYKPWQKITLFNWQFYEITRSRKNFSWECSMIGNIRSILLEIFSRWRVDDATCEAVPLREAIVSSKKLPELQNSGLQHH